MLFTVFFKIVFHTSLISEQLTQQNENNTNATTDCVETFYRRYKSCRVAHFRLHDLRIQIIGLCGLWTFLGVDHAEGGIIVSRACYKCLERVELFIKSNLKNFKLEYDRHSKGPFIHTISPPKIVILTSYRSPECFALHEHHFQSK